MVSVANIIKEVMIKSANDTVSLIKNDSLKQAVSIMEKSKHKKVEATYFSSNEIIME